MHTVGQFDPASVIFVFSVVERIPIGTDGSARLVALTREAAAGGPGRLQQGRGLSQRRKKARKGLLQFDPEQPQVETMPV